MVGIVVASLRFHGKTIVRKRKEWLQKQGLNTSKKSRRARLQQQLGESAKPVSHWLSSLVVALWIGIYVDMPLRRYVATPLCLAMLLCRYAAMSHRCAAM